MSTLPATVLGALVQVLNLAQAGVLAAFFSLEVRVHQVGAGPRHLAHGADDGFQVP